MKMQHNLINTFLVMTAAMPLLINASALSHDLSASSTPLSYYRHDPLRHTTTTGTSTGVLEESPFLRRISTYTRGNKDEDDDDEKKNDDKKDYKTTKNVVIEKVNIFPNKSKLIRNPYRSHMNTCFLYYY
jgi:hypothetical protein